MHAPARPHADAAHMDFIAGGIRSAERMGDGCPGDEAGGSEELTATGLSKAGFHHDALVSHSVLHCLAAFPTRLVCVTKARPSQ